MGVLCSCKNESTDFAKKISLERVYKTEHIASKNSSLTFYSIQLSFNDESQ